MTAQLVPGQTHADFQRSLIGSEGARLSVALWFWRRGWTIELHPLAVAPTVDDRDEYRDDGDLFIWKAGTDRLRIEVKGIRSTPFTSREDWPYPDWIVDSAAKYDSADLKPYATVAVDEQCRAIGIVRRTSFKHWNRVQRTDKVKGQPCWFYTVDLAWVEFVDLRGGPE